MDKKLSNIKILINLLFYFKKIIERDVYEFKF